VDEVVIGLPTDLKGNMSEIETDIQKFISVFEKEFPDKKSIVWMNVYFQNGFFY
jgi:putative Holliday junction resolvase